MPSATGTTGGPSGSTTRQAATTSRNLDGSVGHPTGKASRNGVTASRSSVGPDFTVSSTEGQETSMGLHIGGGFR